MLENLDVFSVYTDPRRRDRLRVAISGQIERPGIYEMQRGQRISDLIERCGGFAADAFLKGAVFRREEVRQRQIEERDKFVREQRKALVDSRQKGREQPPLRSASTGRTGLLFDGVQS